MPTLKNPFAAKPVTRPEPPVSSAPSSPASAPDAVRAHVDLKQKQLRRGTTRAKVESLTAELDAARLALAQAEQAVGDRLVEGLDATAATDAMKQASDRVRILESALTVAIKKDEATQVDLRNAEQQAHRARLREKLTEQLAAGKEVDECHAALTRAVNKFNACRKEVLDFGYPEINAQENVADLSYKTYLFRTSPTMVGCNTGYEVFQTDAKWLSPWSSTLPQPDQADHVRLTPHPTPTPIPGWEVKG